MYCLSFLFMFLGRGDATIGDGTDGTDYWSESYDSGKLIFQLNYSKGI